MSGWSQIHRGAAVTGAALALGALLTACETPLERAWSVSQREHLAQSIANPEAGQHNQEAPRPDGVSTDSALTKYRTTEAEVGRQAPLQIINNIGGGGGGS